MSIQDEPKTSLVQQTPHAERLPRPPVLWLLIPLALLVLLVFLSRG